MFLYEKKIFGSKFRPFLLSYKYDLFCTYNFCFLLRRLTPLTVGVTMNRMMSSKVNQMLHTSSTKKNASWGYVWAYSQQPIRNSMYREGTYKRLKLSIKHVSKRILIFANQRKLNPLKKQRRLDFFHIYSCFYIRLKMIHVYFSENWPIWLIWYLSIYFLFLGFLVEGPVGVVAVVVHNSYVPGQTRFYIHFSVLLPCF